MIDGSSGPVGCQVTGAMQKRARAEGLSWRDQTDEQHWWRRNEQPLGRTIAGEERKGGERMARSASPILRRMVHATHPDEPGGAASRASCICATSSRTPDVPMRRDTWRYR